MKTITALLAAIALISPAGVAAQTPAGVQPSATEGTPFVQVGRLLADPAGGVVQRDKTLVIRGNQIAENRDGLLPKRRIDDPGESFGRGEQFG